MEEQQQRQQLKKVTIEEITSELHNAYNLINERFFNNELPVIAITIQSDARRKLTMGWCTKKEIWGDKSGKMKMYEINLTPEFLDKNFYEVMDTLMHEMVHLYNKIHKVQDVSRSGTYHNSKFKNESIRRGFCYPDEKPDKRYGWSFSELTEETKTILDGLGIDKTVFSIARHSYHYYENVEHGMTPEEADEQEHQNKKGNSIKWECPDCKLIVRSTKNEMSIICGDCYEKRKGNPIVFLEPVS